MAKNTNLSSSPLGREVAYVSQYDSDLLFSVPRSTNRLNIAVDDKALLFGGVDYWQGYELSWLNQKGKPLVAVAEFSFLCSSPNIIESKSFKLYLNSFNQTPFSSFDEVKICLENDLSQASGGQVVVTLHPVVSYLPEQTNWQEFTCIDDLDVEVERYALNPELLMLEDDGVVEETLCSHLLKSNCPITGQPDWASVLIRYQGNKISHESLLKYIISFRNHGEFHEHCVEKMFVDIKQRCHPEKLTVYARYTRRGGLDINPFRSNFEKPYPNKKIIRQ
jgi:7-cyano-7-deazaguanine reductase